MSFHRYDGQRVSVKGGDERKKSGFTVKALHCREQKSPRLWPSAKDSGHSLCAISKCSLVLLIINFCILGLLYSPDSAPSRTPRDTLRSASQIPTLCVRVLFSPFSPAGESDMAISEQECCSFTAHVTVTLLHQLQK